MFKKFLAMVVAIAMLATMFIVPTTVSAVELPTGDGFTIKADDVEPFATGDTVEITFTVTDIPEDVSFLTLDMYFQYNEAILAPNTDAFTSNSADLTAAIAGTKWEMIPRVDDGGILYVGFLDDGADFVGGNLDFVFTASFTALADANPADELIYTTECAAMTVDFEDAFGNGVLVKVAGEAATPVPTEEPTPVPTPEPTPVPTAVPFNADAPVVDIDFSEGFADKAGTLTFQNDDGNGPWYTGSLRLTDKQFTIESYNAVNVGGYILFSAFNIANDPSSGLECWQVGKNVPYVNLPGGLTDGALHHVVITCDGTAFSLYVDGVLVSQDTANVGEVANSFDLTAGGKMALAWGVSARDFFKVYNTAATAEDVAALYEVATYVPPTTPEPTPEPTEKPAFDASKPVINIDYTKNRVVDQCGLLTFGRDASAAKFVNLKDYGYDVKALDNASIGNSLKYTGGDADTSDGLVIELFGVFKENEQFLGKGYWSAECNADGTFGFWETLVGGDAYICSNSSVLDGKAHHIVLVSDGAMMKLYIDGQLDATKEWAQKYNTLTGGSWYLNHTGGTPYIAVNRIYTGADMQMPTDEDIAAMYAKFPVYVYVPVEYTGALVLDSKADKLVYEYGEEFDPAGIAASKIYVNGEVVEITGDITVDASAYNPTVAGKYAIKVSYTYNNDYYTNVFTVRVNEAPYVRSIALVAKPVKLVYAAGEDLDLTGLAVKAYSTDGTTEVITDGIEVTGYDANTVGVQRVTATYAGRTTTFSVRVI